MHIGHDSIVGSHCILANAATLAGHVIIEDFASVGAFSPVHQFCTVGQYAFIGGGTIVTQDVLPFSLTSSRRENKAFGINKVGLARRGFSPERLQTLQKAFRLLLAAKLNTSQALEKIRRLEGEDAALWRLLSSAASAGLSSRAIRGLGQVSRRSRLRNRESAGKGAAS